MNINKKQKKFKIVNLELTLAELIVCLTNFILTISFFIISCCLKNSADNKYGFLRWQSYLSLFANIANTISMILVVKKNINTYIFGAIACINLAFLAWDNKLFGIMIFYWITIVCEVILYFNWRSNCDSNKNIKPTKMVNWHFLIYLLVFISLGIGFMFLETNDWFTKFWFGGQPNKQPLYLLFFDALSLMMMIGTMYLMFKKYSQVWIMYMIFDSCLLSTYIIKLCIDCKNLDLYNLILVAITLIAFNILGIINWRSNNPDNNRKNEYTTN